MSFFKKLKSVFSRLTGSASKIDEFELEDTLIEADFGVELAAKLTKELKRADDLSAALKVKLEEIMLPLIGEVQIDKEKKPFVIVLEGVNGSGKTTTIAKLAHMFQRQELTVDIAACDTFRAAAADQLSEWANRLGCRIFKADTPRDPASVAFEALSGAKTAQSDVLLVDTAGRLHNNTNLMTELAKLHRVLKKLDETAPHLTALVLDATTGQNLVEQVREFGKVHPLSGIIITKLDGHAKGGAIVRIADEFKLPILGVGKGERETDFEKFSIDKFLKDLMG
ncbi:MAG: signal recognition particle-docking protein FtsY [Alphaproteobacteria bacterium]|nr:signal recognition particle-docking protein FtsY [Alphaproteobacteria bacterium]